MPLAPLNNQVVFKKLFQDPQIIQAFVKDLIGIDIPPTNIEIEKQFTPPVGAVDFQIDVFVEDPHHRIVLEIQRVRYDYHYDRFLYYHFAATLNLVKGHMFYKLDRTVYTIVWLTSRSKDPDYQHGVITTTFHSVTDRGETVSIYPHKIYFLNPHYMSDQTPKGIADWMQLIQASISPPPQPEVASERDIIHRAAALISEDGLTPQERIQAIEENEYEAHLQLRYDEGAQEGKQEGLLEGEQKGKQEGLLEGEQKGKLEVARNMLASGIPPADVAKFTGLSLDDLAALD
jgi:predicted transposase/invertase (TIGR01784 family)